MMRQFSGSGSVEGFQSINPYTKQELHNIPYSSHDKILSQIEQLSNPTNPPLEFRKLIKLQSILSLKKHQLAKIITLETGKPISQSILEIEKCVGHIGTWIGSGKGGSGKGGKKGLVEKYVGLKRIGGIANTSKGKLLKKNS